MISHYSQQQARHWRESAKSLFTKYTLIQERMIEWKMTLGWGGYLLFPRLVGVLGMGGSGGCLLELVVMCHRGCAVVPGSLLAGVPFGFRVCSLPCAVALLSGCPWRIYGSAGLFSHTSCWCFGFLAFAIDCDHLGFLGACGFSLFGYLNSGKSGDFDERWGVLTGQFTSLSGLIWACVFILD